MEICSYGGAAQLAGNEIACPTATDEEKRNAIVAEMEMDESLVG